MVALVTGASRGIGSAIAAALARDGWDVALGYLHNEQSATLLARQLGEQYGVRCIAVGCDVSSPQQVEAMFAAIEDRLGEVSLLVNNAGIALQALLSDTTEEEWNKLFDVDVKGVFLCTRRALGPMVRAHHGSIINISSVWGLCGASCEVAYSAAKAAVIGFSKALAKELGPSGIRVNCIAPGVIDTDMNSQLDKASIDALCDETPLGRIGTPDEVAALAVFLSGKGAGFITGQVISPNGGMVL